MNHPPVLLAAVVDTSKIPSLVDQWNSQTSSMREISIVIGAIALVSLGLFCWAIFIRKPRRQRSPHYGGRESERGMLLEESQMRKPRTSRWSKSGRRRHRKRRERPRNPTLADTGGLPPIREEKPPLDSKR